jgi:hypothetical protein
MILYSHRPKLGVSVAAVSKDGQLHIAVATTHSRLDSFSRARARQILNGRLNIMPHLTYVTDISVQDFMRAFKAWFKPTVDESDSTFPKKIAKRRNKIFEMIVAKSTDIVEESVPF